MFHTNNLRNESTRKPFCNLDICCKNVPLSSACNARHFPQSTSLKPISLERNTNKTFDSLADRGPMVGTSSACSVSIIHHSHSWGMKKRNYVALWEEKPDPSPNKGKCEYDKAFPSDTQPNKQPSVIFISGAWCAALKRHLESFMLHPQLSRADYLLNYWVKFGNAMTYA